MITALFVSVLAVNCSFADTTLQFAVYDQSNKRVRVDTVRIRSGVVRLPETAGNFLLFDHNSRQLTRVDMVGKSYTPVNSGSIDQVKKKTREVVEEVRKALEKMPAAQRAQIEKALGALDSNPLETILRVPRVRVVQTGRTQQLNGTNCSVTETFTEKVKRFEACLTPASNLQISAVDAEAYNDYMNYMVDFSRAISASGAAGPGVVANRGIALSYKQFLPDGTVVKTLLENVSTQALDPRLFVIPNSFKDLTPTP